MGGSWLREQLPCLAGCSGRSRSPQSARPQAAGRSGLASLVAGQGRLAISPSSQPLITFVVGDPPARLIGISHRPGEMGEERLVQSPIQGPVAPLSLVLRPGLACVAFAAAHGPIGDGACRLGRTAVNNGTGMNAYGRHPQTGRRVRTHEGRSSDGRHTTQLRLRSALTAGPCSNSLFRHPVFRFSTNHPTHRQASRPAVDQVPRGHSKTVPWTPWPQVPVSDTPPRNFRHPIDLLTTHRWREHDGFVRITHPRP